MLFCQLIYYIQDWKYADSAFIFDTQVTPKNLNFESLEDVYEIKNGKYYGFSKWLLPSVLNTNVIAGFRIIWCFIFGWSIEVNR